jgi:hypothetical protein
MTIPLLLDVQSDLLGIIGQEAVAHAALIFASLAATFAFATGFMERVNNRWGQVIYVVFLGPLIGIAVYAVFRMYLWGTLLGAVTNNPLELALTKCPNNTPTPHVPVGSLSFYWACVNAITSNTVWIPFITVRTLSTSVFSLVLGFIISIGLLSLALTPGKRKPVRPYMIVFVVILLVILTIITGYFYRYYPFMS